MKWSVELRGDLGDLAALVRLDAGVIREGDTFAFRSTEHDDLPDANAVRQHTVKRLELLKGMVRLKMGGRQAEPISVGVVRRLEDRTQFLQLGIAEDIPVVNLPIPPRELTELAECDPNVRKVLKFFGRQPTAANLWMAFEVLRHAVGGGHEIERRWKPGPNLGRFTYWIGRKGRHAVPEEPRQKRGKAQQRRKATRPRKPVPVRMDLSMAREFLRHLILQWLKELTAK